ISHVAFQRNNIPRKSLNYQTPIECFMSYVGDKFDKSILSRLF
ncbi:MAG TPA: IS30 family transposase, partial [Pseudogracilibacillus sp.]|nr:IS30 family transposase [Pseudogracilibacillus sp.]